MMPKPGRAASNLPGHFLARGITNKLTVGGSTVVPGRVQADQSHVHTAKIWSLAVLWRDRVSYELRGFFIQRVDLPAYQPDYVHTLDVSLLFFEDPAANSHRRPREMTTIRVNRIYNSGPIPLQMFPLTMK